MSWRTLFDPGSFFPYRPPSIALSLAMMLLGAVCSIPLVSLILEFRELRYGTIVTSGVVQNVVNRVNDTGKRSYMESVVIYAFVTPDSM